MKRNVVAGMALTLTALVIGACSTAPKTQAERDAIVVNANAAIQTFKAKDPGLQQFFDSAYGYAVFPNVGKVGFIASGTYGQGVVFEQGRQVGFTNITQGAVGATAGAQTFQQIIFFETKPKFQEFTSGKFALAAQASAVAVTAGASADADYDKGVAIFTMGQGGLMVDASVGGQGFSYKTNAMASAEDN